MKFKGKARSIKDKTDSGRNLKRARHDPQQLKPTKDAPFDVDASDDGDIATPKRDLSEDEIKEQEDRRS